MYQIPYAGGFEIQVMSASGYEARVEQVNVSPSQTRFSGSIAECEQWLADRSIRKTAAGRTGESIAATGRGGNR